MSKKPKFKCPYCGRLFRELQLRLGMIPEHKVKEYNTSTCDQRWHGCYGAGKLPRAEDDTQQLWKDDPSRSFLFERRPK